MNNVNLVGRLTKDPEIKTTTNGTAYLPFCLAVSRNDKNKTTDFIDCLAWNKTAEFIVKYFKKGKPIEVTGSVQTRTYDNQEGKKIKVTEVVADVVGFAVSDSTQNSGTESSSGEEPFTI